MGRRSAARAAAAEVRAAADGNLGAIERIIADARARRERLGDLSPFELPIVVACRQLVADTVAQLPLVNFRGNLPTAEQPPIVIRPDPWEPRWQTMHRLVMNLTGPGYVWLIPTAFYADGVTPAAVRVVDAAEAAGTFDPSGRLERIIWQGIRYDPGPTGAVWIPWRVERVGTLGTGPIGSCMQAVEYLAALWQMAGSFWEAGFPSIALVIEGALSTTQKREAKDEMLAAFARRHEPAVVDRGGRLEPIGSNAVDSQLVESIEVANAEVARAFAVMPSLVNVRVGDSLTYATTEAELSKWLKLGLGAYLMRIEAGFSELRPLGQHVRADSSALLRTDLSARYGAYSVALGRWLTVDEVRAAESLRPMPAGTFPGEPTSPAVTPSPFLDPSGVLP